MNPWIIIKFGGTSVSGTKQWSVIQSIIDKHTTQGHRVMLVHSAFSGLTNALEQLIQGDSKQLAVIKSRLLNLLSEFNMSSQFIQQNLVTLNQLAQSMPYTHHTQAQLLAWGEQVTHRICLAHLNTVSDSAIQSFDPTQVLISSDEDKRNTASQILSAKCPVNYQTSLDQQLTAPVYVMPGFIANDHQGRTVVLGRGGSDTSAAYMAVLLNAQKLEIWTDVHGIFSANPHANPNARLLLQLGYQEAREIAASGGAVLHPRCILPVEQKNIPLHIKNTQDSAAHGTILSHAYQPTKPTVYAINTRHQVTLVSLESINMWHQAGFLGDMFNVFKDLGLSVDLISTSQTNVTLSLDQSDNILSKRILEHLSTKLAILGQVEIIKNCSAVTLVGYRIRALADKIASVVATFSDQRIYITTQSSNDLNQTFVVDEDQADRLARALHEVLIPNDDSHSHFGQTWHQLQQHKKTNKKIKSPWWKTKQQRLLKMAENESPCYVYNSETIKEQINQLQSLTAVDKIHYACKANSTEAIIRLIAEEGLSFETVSPEEIRNVLAICGKDVLKHILFTPNFAPKSEYQWAAENDILTTIDNPMILEQWADIFHNKSILLRIDPGHGSGHHRYVRTAGEQSKFGIPVDKLPDIASICVDNDIKVVGLHAHSGSGILDHNNWQRVVEALQSHRHLFPEAHVLNIGGGLGIKENPGDVGLDFDAFNQHLLAFKSKYPNTEIWIEPGRFVVANSGVLLAKVTQSKMKGQQGYIGLETGMNSLIRPALYGAWHNIVNLTRLDSHKTITANIVGPMCETGDILGIDRKMPKTENGDVVLIANTGAYGTSMSSQYNLRQPAKNILI